jgi:putative nucleotidyltransferase with HDIG domain
MRGAAEAVVGELRRAGHETYFAGGSVRDLVMERVPHDYDIATIARPEEVMALFPRTVAVGVSFGVVVVLYGDHEFEVATFRADGVYLDGRHPTAVHYSSAAEDVARRDFTINGLLYDPEAAQVIDHVGGQADIAARVVRCIGDPRARFGEDRLRMLRAVRFVVRFGFEMEPATWDALRDQASAIGDVSAERIRDELLKMLTGPTPDRALALLEESGLLAEILPEVAAMKGVDQPPEFHPEGDVFVHTTRALAALDPPPDSLLGPGGRQDWETEALWLATLLHDVGKPPTHTVTDRVRFNGHAAVGAPMAEKICRRLRLSTHHVQRTRDLVAGHMLFGDVERMRPAKRLRFLRLDHFADLLALHRADRLAGAGDLQQYDYCRNQLDDLVPEQLRPPRLLDGHALQKRGVKPGPRLGALLRELEDAQLEGDVTTRVEAEAWLARRLEVEEPVEEPEP